METQVFFDRLGNTIGMIDVCFVPSKGKMMLQDWIGSNPNHILAGDELDEVNGFGYLGS